ncbi:MAG: histidinol-phosphate transaminase [SAR324 cluster bacterium]|nr:histidinol-phosphate transaminase [SAR324 cluster bacterium]
MKDLSHLFHPDFKSLQPYSPIEPPSQIAKRLGLSEDEIIKLDANENPFGLHPRLQQVLSKQKYLHIYPDPAQVELRAAISDYAGVTPEQIVAGAGADEIIDLAMRLFLEKGDQVLSFGPTFSYYDHVAALNHAEFILEPREEDFSIDIEKVKKLDLTRVKLVFLCSPNNPSGNQVEEAVVDYLLRHDLIVLVDEAYGEFSGVSLVEKLKTHSNLVILKTFSKCFALAGLRVGYGITSKAIASQLMKIKPPYGVNVAAEVLLKEALANMDIFKGQVAEIIATRDWFFAEVSKLDGIQAYESQANYILLRILEKDALTIKNQLEQEGILVRYFNREPLTGCIRVTIGLKEQMEKLLVSLKAKL